MTMSEEGYESVRLKDTQSALFLYAHVGNFAEF